VIHLNKNIRGLDMPRKKTQTSEERLQYQLDFAKKKYKRVPLDLPIDDYEQLKAYCESKGTGINTFIKSAISEKMTRDK
jgi:hypothetical protein